MSHKAEMQVVGNRTVEIRVSAMVYVVTIPDHSPGLAEYFRRLREHNHEDPGDGRTWAQYLTDNGMSFFIKLVN